MNSLKRRDVSRRDDTESRGYESVEYTRTMRDDRDDGRSSQLGKFDVQFSVNGS